MLGRIQIDCDVSNQEMLRLDVLTGEGIVARHNTKSNPGQLMVR